MHVASVDQGFVAASPDAVFARLADPATYPAWWPDATAGALRLGGGDVRMVQERRREGIGLTSRLEGRVPGTLEWYLEAFEDGTIVHAILHLQPPGGARRSARRLLRARASLRRGLLGLKRDVEDG